MGSEFVPSLNEGDFAIQALRIPGTSLSQSVQMQQQMEKTLKAKFPEIERIFARTGTAEIASDPMPPNISDGYIMLKPMDEWPEPRKTRDDAARAIPGVQGKLPGNNYEFSQPIQLRFNELISGVRSDVAVKIFGDDMAVLNKSAEEVSADAAEDPGLLGGEGRADDGLPMLTVNIDRQKAARYGLNVGDIQDTWPRRIGGREAGTMFEGDRRFDMVWFASLTPCATTSKDVAAAHPAAGVLPVSPGQLGFIRWVRSPHSSLLPWPQPGQPRERQAPHRGEHQRAGRDVGSFVARGRARPGPDQDALRATGRAGAEPSRSCNRPRSACRSWCRVPAAGLRAVVRDVRTTSRMGCWSSPASHSL
jgi:cobalt-zinc-cadmium resistance protein CzcA